MIWQLPLPPDEMKQNLVQSTTGISAQQSFAVAINKKIRFTGESVKAQMVLKLMNPAYNRISTKRAVTFFMP